MDNISKEITIRQILSHTSGMADYLDEDLLEDDEPVVSIFLMNRLLTQKTLFQSSQKIR